MACCSPWGHKESDTIERLNWTELRKFLISSHHLLFMIVIIRDNNKSKAISLLWTEIILIIYINENQSGRTLMPQIHSCKYLEKYRNFPWKKNTNSPMPTELFHQTQSPHAFNWIWELMIDVCDQWSRWLENVNMNAKWVHLYHYGTMYRIKLNILIAFPWSSFPTVALCFI